jgi:hypothetical protein
MERPKSFFARSELKYLGYWVTREGIQPISKKVDAMLQIAPPKNKKELRRFIGMINYYRLTLTVCRKMFLLFKIIAAIFLKG